MATASMPTVWKTPISRASMVLVPAPSAPATRTASLIGGMRMMPPSADALEDQRVGVDFSRCRSSRTASLPASTSTPESLYVNSSAMRLQSGRSREGRDPSRRAAILRHGERG